MSGTCGSKAAQPALPRAEPLHHAHNVKSSRSNALKLLVDIANHHQLLFPSWPDLLGTCGSQAAQSALPRADPLHHAHNVKLRGSNALKLLVDTANHHQILFPSWPDLLGTCGSEAVQSALPRADPLHHAHDVNMSRSNALKLLETPCGRCKSSSNPVSIMA